MKHKHDVYKKPKIPLTEVLAAGTVSLIVGSFLLFEFSAYLEKIPQLDQLLVFNSSDIHLGQNEQTAEPVESVTAETASPTVTKEETATKPAQTDATPVAVAKVEINATAVTATAEENLTAEAATDNDKVIVKMMLANDDPHQKFGEYSLMDKILAETDPLKLQTMVFNYDHFSPEDKAAILIREIGTNHPKTVTKLIDRGFALVEPYPHANQLIFQRHYTMATLLLKRGILDPKSENKYGYTLLHEAAAKGHARLIRLLVSLGADINAQAKDGASALHYPAHLGFNIAVATLIELGIDVNMKATLKYPGLNWNGYTPLHVAASRGKYEIVEQLLKAGAKVDEVDNDGLTAYDIAKQKQYNKVSVLLKPYMLKEGDSDATSGSLDSNGTSDVETTQVSDSDNPESDS